MKPLDHKWNYICTGLSAGLALVGAALPLFWLLVFGAFFAFYNYEMAEYLRRLENENKSNDKTDKK